MTGEPTHAASKDKNYTVCLSYVDYCHCQLCSTHCTAVWIKNYFKNPSVVKVATTKNTSRATAKSTLFTVSNDECRTQNRTLVNPWRMHCMYCAIPKGTSQAKAMVNSEKSKPIALNCYQVTLVCKSIDKKISVKTIA